MIYTGREMVTEADFFNRPDLGQLDAKLEQQHGLDFALQDVAPPWLLVSEALPQVEETARQKTARFLGATAIRGAVEIDTAELSNRVNETTLLAAIHEARFGDAASERMIRTNVATDIAERLFKAGHQTCVHMQIKNNVLQQEGRSMTAVHRNTLEQTVLIPEMLRKTTYELHNTHLVEELHAAGVLATHNLAFFSTSSTTMTAEQKQKYGFFTDTESCSIQWLSANGNDITLETAMVAGKKTPTSDRHDLQAINALLASKGIAVPVTDGTDVLRHVLLVPKQAAKGVGDIVRWYDDAAGGTFYGQDKPRQNYEAYAKECEERTRSFDSMVDAITRQLIAEAPNFTKPLDALTRLDELSAGHCRERALDDMSIDIAVFGAKTAQFIVEARTSIARGDFERANAFMEQAAKSDTSSSCPFFKDSKKDGGDNGPDGDSEEVSGEKWMHCPYCDALVFGDPCARKLSCWDCQTRVEDGVVYIGNGGSAKRAKEQPKPIQTFTQMAEGMRLGRDQAASKQLVSV